MQFGGCTWATSEFEPVSIDDFFLKNNCKHEMNGFKQALVELNNKLDKNEFLTAAYGCYPPVITFIGSVHTSDNLDKQIESLKNNAWYRHAIKIAIKTDTTSDSLLFEKITGNIETVFEISQLDSIRIIYKRLFDHFVS